jgi:hypothetical protein
MACISSRGLDVANVGGLIAVGMNGRVAGILTDPREKCELERRKRLNVAAADTLVIDASSDDLR